VIAVDLYLMQHGEATTEAENPERPLTQAGRAAVERVSSRARAAGVHVAVCVHSGKLRAEQTAQVFVGQLGGQADVNARDRLAPTDPVAPTAQWLRTATEHDAIALIGHLPFLDRLASLLVAGDEGAQVVRFRMGGLTKLEPKDEGDGFTVAWVLPPELA
jgi:phosphohistidine phosphatase